MKRFHFRLERLLQLRGFKERRAELVLAERAGACALIAARITENVERRARTAREMFAAGREVADFRAAELYVRRLDLERERHTRELAIAELAREEARGDYVLKRREREAVDKLRERKETEYYRLAEREDTKTLDDMARRPVAAGPARPLVETGSQ